MSRKMLPLLAVWLLSLLLSPLALAKAQPAGHVIAAGAGVKAKANSGAVRVLKRRSAVYEGDTIITGRGSAQIRFSDGGLTALRPGTTFKIVSYRWKGKQDGSEKGFFSLIKGGLRTISGAIGKKYRDNYKMKTPVATIGIRGTSYFLQWLGRRGLKGGVTKGKIYVWNKIGGRLFYSGQGFFVKSGKFKPQLFTNKKRGGNRNQGDPGFIPPAHDEKLLPPTYTKPSGGGSIGPAVTF